MSFRRVAVAAVLAFASISSATKEKAAQDPISGTDTVHGCYKSYGQMKSQGEVPFNTQGKCTELCRNLTKVAAASNSHLCYCGDEYPAKADLVDDDQCTEPCPGFDTDACGGLDTYTVYNTGLRVTVGESQEASPSSSSTSSADATKTSSASEAPANTSDTIETVTASSEPDSGSGGPNVAGIAAGVVVGVVCVSGLIGGIFFWLRRKRNAEIEEEHRRNAAVNAFISGGGKPPSSSGGLSMSDSRLDPVMNRRMSDGSIADNQDYSRRILRVTNA
ncbi:Histone acetyltransferase [Hypoxylon texense]